MINFVIPIILYFFCIYALKKVIPVFKNKSFVDKPSSRSNHKSSVPKGLGIIIIPSVIFATFITFTLEDSLNYKWIIFLISSLLLCIISFIDDVINLPAKSRLMFQSIVVLISIFFFKKDFVSFLEFNGIIFINEYFSFYLLVIAIFILWLWIINLFNFMDGMDGITSTQIIAFSILLNFLGLLNKAEINSQYLSLILLSAFLAFHKYNKSPALAFLGDSGSIPLGYIVGFILFDSMTKFETFLALIIILLYYFLDSTITLIKRLIKGENIFIAHSDHFYQKMIRKGKSHSQVLKIISILWVLLGGLSLLSIILPLISLILGLALTIFSMIFFQRKI